MTWERYRAELARSKTCCSIVLPAMTARALPGKRDDANRAGITPRIRVGTFDHSMKDPFVILGASRRTTRRYGREIPFAVPSFRPSARCRHFSLLAAEDEGRQAIHPRSGTPSQYRAASPPVQGARRSGRPAGNQYPRRDPTGPDQCDRHRPDEPVRHGPGERALQTLRRKGRADDHAVLERRRAASA